MQPDGYLRLRVDGGGCSGFQYKFELTQEQDADDVVFERDGAKLLVDEGSLEMVRGSTVDFVEEMISSSFQARRTPFAASARTRAGEAGGRGLALTLARAAVGRAGSGQPELGIVVRLRGLLRAQGVTGG